MQAGIVTSGRRVRMGGVPAAAACVAACLTFGAQPASAASQASRIDAAVRQSIRVGGINAVIVQATVNGKTVIKKAYGNSQTGVPATTAMHFRNGNVVAAYMTTLLLKLVEQRKVKLDDPISKWVPNMPDGDRVTLRMLAGMTSGYQDYIRQTPFISWLYGHPFDNVSTKQQLAFAFGTQPNVQFTPGTNFAYSHTNYVILGLALEKITRMRLETALSRYVLKPLGLRNTTASQTSVIPEPALHTVSSERRGYFALPADASFVEDTTYWNPSFSFARGSVETTDITDLTRTAIGIGQGKLLSRSSYRLQTDGRVGFGHKSDDCPGCRPLQRTGGYGLGVFTGGSWISAQPLFFGLASVMAYNPSRRVSIAVAVTFNAKAYDADGSPTNYSKPLFSQIGKILAPTDPPPA